MKKIFLIIALMLFTVTSINAQDFNRWAISGEFGNQMVGDKTAISVDQFQHFGSGLRYNFNEIIGAGVTGGYDLTSLSEELSDGSFGPEYDLTYSRINLEGYLNAFKAVDLYSKRWTVLFHGGPGVSLIETNGTRLGNSEDQIDFNHNEQVLNLRGGATLLFKVSKRVALFADFSTTSNVNQTKKFDGSGEITNTGMSSNVSNVSAGLTIYLGKKGKEHADWYQKPEPTPVVNNVVNEYVTNNPVINFTQEEFNEYYETYLALNPISEFVFFDHDKSEVKATELNAMYKVYVQLAKNPSWVLTIRGFASPTSSSADYNQKLSERRTNALKDKFIKMGVDPSRIETDSLGKDLDRSNSTVHDIARRVELIVTK